MEDRVVNEDPKAIDPIIKLDTLDEYQGNEIVKKRIKLFLEGAKRDNRQPDHILIHGPSGTGKTSLAKLIFPELKIYLAEHVEQKSITGMMAVVKEGEAILLDELQSIKPNQHASLAHLLEEKRIYNPIINSYEDIPPCTIIGSTLNLGKLPDYLINRFTHQFRTDFYDDSTLASIASQSAVKLNLDIAKTVPPEIAKRSRGIPRLSNRFLKIARDYNTSLTPKRILEVFNDLGIDKHGLDMLDKKYLETLRDKLRCGPSGVETIASIMGYDSREVERYIEPYLVRMGFVLKTPRGRVIGRRF